MMEGTTVTWTEFVTELNGVEKCNTAALTSSSD